jgi:lysozyme family protein
MADFDQAITTILENEGTYSNDLQDPGGETKFGISKRSFPHIDIKNLTLQDAKAIYKTVYWKFESVLDQAIATKLLDMSVNLGPAPAVRLLQSLLKVTADGVFGPKSLAAVNAADHTTLLQSLRYEQAVYYAQLIARTPSLVKYARGWLKRALQ